MANTAVLEQPKRGESHGFTWVSAEGRQLSKTGEWDVVGQQHQILSAKVEPGETVHLEPGSIQCGIKYTGAPRHRRDIVS
jgi:hypothetical protein